MPGKILCNCRTHRVSSQKLLA